MRSSPADRFVAVRNELAARVKAAGYQNLAIRLRSMKRSPMAVWLANALAHETPKVIQSLHEASANLRKADSGESDNGIHGASTSSIKRSVKRRDAMENSLTESRRERAMTSPRRPPS
jgi:hypothetical protein